MNDVIPYTPAFAKAVGGRVFGRFRTAGNGDPVYREDEDGTRHYTVDVYLESPNADRIDLVEYIIGDRTFHVPKGFSEDPSDHFHEVIRTYGDVPIDVKVYMGIFVRVQQVWLSELLQNGHAGDTNPAVLDAIARIKAN
jgi:hypothetical protein